MSTHGALLIKKGYSNRDYFFYSLLHKLRTVSNTIFDEFFGIICPFSLPAAVFYNGNWFISIGLAQIINNILNIFKLIRFKVWYFAFLIGNHFIITVIWAKHFDNPRHLAQVYVLYAIYQKMVPPIILYTGIFFPSLFQIKYAHNLLIFHLCRSLQALRHRHSLVYTYHGES